MRIIRFRSTVLLTALALLAAFAIPASATTPEVPETNGCADVQVTTPALADVAAAEAEGMIVGATVLDEAIAQNAGWCYDCCQGCDPRQSKVPCDRFCGCNCDDATLP